MFKKIVSSIILASYLFSVVFVPVAYASAPTWYDPGFKDYYIKVFDDKNPDEIFGERYTQAQVTWILYSIVSLILNALGSRNIAFCMISFSDNLTALFSECLPVLQDLVASSDARSDSLAKLSPHSYFSTIDYFKEIGTKLKIIPEAEAQGFGYDVALNPVRALWGITRNLSYFLLVIAMVILSFMVMFRVKTSPQTVITVQSALPRVILALILITFSYAIAGFMIDIMYVVVGLIAAIIANANLMLDGTFETTFNTLAARNSMDLMFSYFIGFIVISLFAIFSNALGILVAIGITAGFALASGPAILLAIILLILLLVVLTVLAFRIWFMLIKTFVSILLLTIAAPFIILGGVLGGGGFGSWAKNMAAHLAIYPAVGVMFFVAFLFLGASIPTILKGNIFGTTLASLLPFNPDPNVFGSSSWIPPLTWGTSDLDILWLAVSVVIISLIPKTADMVKSLVQGRPFAYGAAIGESMGPVMAAGATAGGWARQRAGDLGKSAWGGRLGRYTPGWDRARSAFNRGGPAPASTTTTRSGAGALGATPGTKPSGRKASTQKQST